MIVIGIGPHMKTHAAVALDATTGRSLAEKTVSGDASGHDELLSWARTLGPARFFAIEDCRHVSGRLERHLLPRGERVVRVPPKMMARARSSARTYGKSDPIDAACVAHAALREPDLPEARLVGPEHDVRLLVDHRDDLVGERKRISTGRCGSIVSRRRCEHFRRPRVRAAPSSRRGAAAISPSASALSSARSGSSCASSPRSSSPFPAARRSRRLTS